MSGGSAYAAVLQRLQEVTGYTPRGRDNERTAHCPAHEDHDPSLSAGLGRDGKVLLHCHAGCDLDAILAALNMTRADLFEQPRAEDSSEWLPCRRDRCNAPKIAEYEYVDVEGEVLFHVTRCANKHFAQWRPDPTARGRRRWNLQGIRRVLYHLPSVIEAAKNGDRVYVVEGEKDVHAVERAGAVATTCSMGAGKWREEYAQAMRGCSEVVIVADHDEPRTDGRIPGREHAQRVSASLTRAGIPHRIVEAREGKDAHDHLMVGHTLDELIPLDLDEVAVGDDLSSADELFRRDVAAEVRRQRVRDEAARILRNDRDGVPTVPDGATLQAFLATPDNPVRYRIDGIWPVNGRIVLAAQRKAGKTILVGNTIRALADGHPFLGTYAATPPAGAVALVDFELAEGTLRRWLREQDFHRPDRVIVYPMRGQAAGFDLRDPATRTAWAANLRRSHVSVLIVDCLRPILDALGLDENRDAGRFLVVLDTLLAEAGIGEALIVHHMGHTGERARGDSRLRDWPDAEWRLVRDAPDVTGADDNAPRYFAAYGRDVNEPEGLLEYDQRSRHLTLAGGSRADTAVDAIIPDIIDWLTDNPASSGRQIEAAMVNEYGHGQKESRKAIKRAVAAGKIAVEKGKGRARLHSVRASDGDTPDASMRQGASPMRQRVQGECVSASSPMEATHTHTPTRTNPADPSASADAHRPDGGEGEVANA